VSALEDSVVDRLRTEHCELLATISDCADAVATDFETAVGDASATADREKISSPLLTTLSKAGVYAQFPAVLTDVVSAAGYQLSASPVAAPPYVVIASTGPVLRATLPPGRLVISIRLFEPVRTDQSLVYVCGQPETETEWPAVDVELR